MKKAVSFTEKPWYQWVIAALCFLMTFTILGFCSSSRGVYITAITEALGISRSAYSLSDTLRYIATTVCNLFFGALLAKLGPRKMIAAGFAATIISTLLYALGDNIFYFYIGSIFLGLGVAWTSTTMIGAVVNRWFTSNRGSVMGAALAANGLGSALALQIVTPIIHGSVFGYQKAYRLVLFILLAVGTVILFLFRNEPAKAPEGQIKTKKRRGQNWPGISYSTAVKKVYFYASLVCIFVTGMILQGISGVSAPHLEDVGLDPGYIALVLSVHSVSLAFFKFAVGVIYDRTGLRITSNICFVASVIVLVILACITNSPSGKVLAMVYGIGISLALPLETIMLPIYASDLFGDHSYPKLLGIVTAVNTAGFALGSPIANVCYDLTGSYHIALYGGATLMVVATVIMQFVISAAHKQQKKLEEQPSGA